MAAKMLAVGEVAARSGVAITALHYYETRGLIRAERTSGNQRRYPRDVLRRLAFIRAAQQVGIALEDIGAALSTLPQQRTPTRADWAKLSAAWRSDLDARIAQLQLLRSHLDDCIGCGCLSLRRCRLYNPDDALAAQGSGAQRFGES